MRRGQFALVLLCGTVTLAGWCAARLGGVEWLENAATPIWNREATRDATTSSADAGRVGAALGRAVASVASASFHLKLPEPAVASAAEPAADAATVDPARGETGFALASVSEASAVEAALPDSQPTPLETRGRLVSLFRPEPETEDPQPAARPIETLDECLVIDICIDEYLWSLYERTPKVDTNKVTEKIKATVKTKKGKTRTVTKTITKYVVADFTWKDPIAAQRVGMSLKDYVIGGMDRRFKLKLFRALRAMDDAGHMPGITSAFRDDYRQSIAAGNKAASDSSFHGGSRRGGYGHGLAIDLVSVKGETRLQRFASSEVLWKWVDAHEKELGVGRPYLDRDPPHVTPIDGREYAAKRGRPAVQKAASKAPAPKSETRKPQADAGNDASTRAKQATPSKVSSLAAPAQPAKSETAKRPAGASDPSMRAKQAKSPKVSSLAAPTQAATKRQVGAGNAPSVRAKQATPSKASSLPASAKYATANY